MPVWHAGLERNADPAAVAALEALLVDGAIAKRGYDLKRELLAWRRRGIAIQGLQFDAMLAAYLTNSRLKVPTLPVLAHDLAALSVEAEETLLGSGRSKRGIADVPIEEAAAYFGVWVGLHRSSWRRARARHGASQCDAAPRHDGTAAGADPCSHGGRGRRGGLRSARDDQHGDVHADQRDRSRGAGGRRVHVQPWEHAAARPFSLRRPRACERAQDEDRSEHRRRHARGPARRASRRRAASSSGGSSPS